MPEAKYKEIHVQSNDIELGNKIEIGGHLVEVIGVDRAYRKLDDRGSYVIIHALDLSSRVYEIKFQWAHPLVVHKKIKVSNGPV